MATSPRIDPRLVAAAFVLDDRNLPYAETWRRVGEMARRLQLPPPSYDSVRILLRVDREERESIRRALEPVAGDILVGRFAPWDVDRIREAADIASRARRRHAK